MEILEELLSKLLTKEVIIGAAIFLFALWIVYRPDLKVKRVFEDFLGIASFEDYQFNKQEMEKKWKAIENGLDQTRPSTWQVALEEAYKLFDFVLEKKVPQGKSFQERFNILSKEHERMVVLLSALEVRDQIQGKGNYHIQYWQIEDVLKRFKTCFQELEVF